MKVAVFGAGRLAEAVVRIVGARGAEVRLWARREPARVGMKDRHAGITIFESAAAAAEPADLVIFCVPAGAIEEVAAAYGDGARGDQVVLHAARGVASGFRLPHQLIRAKTCVRKIGALGGPLHARELGSGRPLAAVIGSRFDETIACLRKLTQGTQVRVHPTKDIIGVEVAGAISNVSALAAGMADKLGLGETARGVLLTRGLSEGLRLGAAIGAHPGTFAGLAGVGDLIPRHVSSTDRHLAIGAALAEGRPLAEALSSVEGAVEGVDTAQAAVEKARALGIELPMVSAVASVLSGAQSAASAVEAVLAMDLDLGGFGAFGSAQGEART